MTELEKLNNTLKKIIEKHNNKLEKHSCYFYELQKINETRWHYIIYGDSVQPYYDGIKESEEWYKAEDEARKGAIDRIEKMEAGE